MSQIPLQLATTQQIVNELERRQDLEYVLIAIARHDPYFARLAYSHNRAYALQLLAMGSDFLNQSRDTGEADKRQW